MRTKIEFYTDATEGEDCIVHFSMSGTKESVLHRVKEIVRDIETHGKPIQGCVSTFNGISHIITPVWEGREY